MVLTVGNIAAAVAVVEVAKLLTEVSLSRATNRYQDKNDSMTEMDEKARAQDYT